MLVPAETLEPPVAYGRGFDPHETALLLDGYLRRLASQENRCRLILGALAAAFLRQSGHHLLGFARLGDWARERLGRSSRDVQSLASVHARLEALPRLRAAFLAGRLSWAQTRLLVGVATEDDEERWLAFAEHRTVRALEAVLRASRAAPVADDDEPRAEFRLHCPRRLLVLWRDTVELARRMAGAQLTQGDAAEAIAAEALSARPPADEAWPVKPPPAPLADPSETRDVFPIELDWSAVDEAVPDDVEPLARDIDACDPFVLEARMRVVVRALQRIDWQMGRLLRVFVDRRLYWLMQFPSAARYLRERLGISPRKARALVALERKTWTTPGLGEAYRDSELSWARALTILPVVNEETGPAWIARAGEVTVRRLTAEVEWALVVRDGITPIAPPPPGADLVLDERQMCARRDWEYPDAEIVFRAAVSVVSLFRTAVLTFAGPSEGLWQGLENLLRHVKAEWEGQPPHRDLVFARDGWRCAVPACSSRRNLHDHHILFRSRGGDNARDNRVTVCAWHHLRGIHGGHVRAWGEAPDGITWELGVRAGRRPLLRLEGDRYTPTSTPSPSTFTS
ncbi:MAG TPA: HNH endonuclease signature motif containing protein [Candidatus Binatia bacterium]|nr:HNH endonuclease signature motif containing protein [Candidatus Binatia bacterium]